MNRYIDTDKLNEIKRLLAAVPTGPWVAGGKYGVPEGNGITDAEGNLIAVVTLFCGNTDEEADAIWQFLAGSHEAVSTLINALHLASEAVSERQREVYRWAFALRDLAQIPSYEPKECVAAVRAKLESANAEIRELRASLAKYQSPACMASTAASGATSPANP